MRPASALRAAPARVQRTCCAGGTSRRCRGQELCSAQFPAPQGMQCAVGRRAHLIQLQRHHDAQKARDPHRAVSKEELLTPALARVGREPRAECRRWPHGQRTGAGQGSNRCEVAARPWPARATRQDTLPLGGGAWPAPRRALGRNRQAAPPANLPRVHGANWRATLGHITSCRPLQHRSPPAIGSRRRFTCILCRA